MQENNNCMKKKKEKKREGKKPVAMNYIPSHKSLLEK